MPSQSTLFSNFYMLNIEALKPHPLGFFFVCLFVFCFFESMKHVHFYFKNCLAPGFLGKCLLSMMTKIHALISMYKLLIPTCPVGYKGRKDIALWRQIRLWWSQFKVTIGNNPKGTGITSVINLIDSK